MVGRGPSKRLALGQRAEALVASFLEERGYTITTRNCEGRKAKST